MKYKLIVSDLDDTLLDDNLGHSTRLVEAIDEYVAAGGIFTVATGRMTQPMLKVCRELGIKGKAISYQGAVISDIESGKTLAQINISTETAYNVCQYLQGMGVYYQVYHDDRILIKHRTEYSDLYSKFSDCGFIEHGDRLPQYVKESGICPVKIMLMEDPSQIEGHIKELDGIFGKEVLVNTSKKWLIEMINKDTNKGTAVQKIATKYGITAQDVICIGDSLNDLSMIRYAGLGVCVSNGSKALMSEADYVCPSNNDDGVAHVIYKFGLEKTP